MDTKAYRRRAIAMAAMLLLVGLAGCLGDPSDGSEAEGGQEGADGDDATEEGNRTIPWGVESCRVVVAVIPVDEGAIAEQLPEGFSPISAEEAFGLPPDPRGEGALGLETFACERGMGLDGWLEGVDYGAVFAPVDPPEDVYRPEVDLVMYKWETLVPDEPRRDALQAAGLPAVDGSSDLSGLEETPLGHSFDVSVELGDLTIAFTGTAGAPNEDFREGLPFIEYQQAEGGLAYWTTFENEAAGANSGTGAVTVSGDHWVVDLLEGQEPAYMVASTDVTFQQAQIGLPG